MVGLVFWVGVVVIRWVGCLVGLCWLVVVSLVGCGFCGCLFVVCL